jgi:hypothetical protein
MQRRSGVSPSAGSTGGVLALFAGTLFLAAGLMFAAEPMIARMMLPRLGGSASVWSVCLVFFQATLLLGYLYAHALRRLPLRAQVAVHLLVVVPAAALVLPLDLGAGAPRPDDVPALWQLERLAWYAFPPLFAISATAPLLQAWFARLNHRAAGDPYFLYVASNAGSLLALLAYPLAIEPLLPLSRQSGGWALGFAAMALAIASCAVSLARHAAPARPPIAGAAPAATWAQRVAWIALSFAPSSLLLGVTAHIATDVASAPLLWVPPLALYLLTFILAFARRPPVPPWLVARAAPLLLIPLIVATPPWLLLPLHLATFFVLALLCHGELARRRPPAGRLTEFYLYLAVGGALGGLFNALLAPLLFPGVWEYPLLLAATCLALPGQFGGARWARRLDLLLPAALLALLLLTGRIDGGADRALWLLAALPRYMIPALLLLWFSERQLRFALGVAVCVGIPVVGSYLDTELTARSYYGVYRVRLADDGQTRVLIHGTTVHGVESLLPGEARLPLGYYSHAGPFGRFFASLPASPARRVGVIGLGVGDLACYATPGQAWTFYEIDPLVERIARDARLFRFLAECGNTPSVVLGDARLALAGAADAGYDVLVLDAFSSDSIPIHLLTREAFALYLRKLAPHGALLVHISNRWLDLAPVVAALARDAGLAARMLVDEPPAGPPSDRRIPAAVVALARADDLGTLLADPAWAALPPPPAGALWTDQRSDILRVIRSPF